MKEIDKEIILVTDPWEKDTTFSLKRKDIEGNTRETAMKMVKELKLLSDRVSYFVSPILFSKYITDHKNVIVINTYYGSAKANSKALIPSICEVNQIPYVGADSYTQMLCNDKYLTKKYITDFGLNTPDGILIRFPKHDDLNIIKSLKLPLVIKPNYGGGSNGISNKNLMTNYEEAKKLIIQLAQYQNMPILVEEYIPGYESELVIFGNKEKIFFSEEIGLQVNGIEYFDNHLWGYEAKKQGLYKNILVPTTHISTEDLAKMIKLFQSFEKAEIMRIDCRIHNETAYILELSPDCYLGPTGGVAQAFANNHIKYSHMFRHLILNSLHQLN